MGYLDIAVGPQIYALYTAYDCPPRTENPGQHVIYTPNAGTIAQKNQENLFALEYRNHHDKKHMDRALIDRLYLTLCQARALNIAD